MDNIPKEPMDTWFDMIRTEMNGKFAMAGKKPRPTKTDLKKCKDHFLLIIADLENKIKNLLKGGYNMASTEGRKTAEESFETGKDEAYWGAAYDQVRSWNANVKHQFDFVLDEWKKHNLHFHETMAQARRQVEDLHNAKLRFVNNHIESDNMVSKQAVKHSESNIELMNRHAHNGIETDNMTGKQAVKHADLAADAMWTYGNELQTILGSLLGRAVSGDEAYRNAVAAVMIAFLTNWGFAVDKAKEASK